MLEQQTLLRLARDYATRKAAERPSLKAVLLTGSVARGEPALGDAVDLDILLIDDFIPDPPTETVRLSEFVFIDAAYARTADFADRKAARTHHLLAPALNDALPLHDPRHYFDLLQAAIRAPYNRPDHIYARARSAHNAALQSFASLTPFLEDSSPADVAINDLLNFHQALYLAALSPILLTGQPEAVGGRKLMVRFEAAARRLNPELYSQFLAALGVADLDPNQIESFLADWLALYKAANQRGAAGPAIQPLKRGYYERGFRALIAEGHALNTLWLMEHTMAASVRDLKETPEPWLKFRQATGKASGGQFAERARQAETLLALTDETLIAWAKQEQIEW
ncbi:MAG: hypothetical protein HYZ49_19405 [Chloroflexi bacterium]|nr:hypothetical protein [Chloroflexota bacterium]